LVADQLAVIDARAINSLPIGRDENGQEIVARVGRYGSYLQRGEQNASIPDDLPPDALTLAKALELLDLPSGDRQLGVDAETSLPVLARNGRFGAYVQLGEPEKGSKEKPRTCSLLKNQSLDTLTLEDALQLLTLPRTVGVDPADQQPVVAQLGRYGPYVSKGKESRSLEKEEDLFDISLDDALKVLAQPRQRKQRAAAAPLRELGVDAVSGKPITLHEGRFGLYVTDGQTNGSLRQSDTKDGIDTDRAQELLQLRRERGPSKKRPKKATKKKSAAKKATRKKAAPGKKTAAKKGAAKEKGAGKKVSRGPTKKKAAKKKG
jgi:DNA topoisomerase-1